MNYTPYRYKKPKKARRPEQSGKPVELKQVENLSGYINDGNNVLPASDLEERFAIALSKNPNVDNFEFQVSYIAGQNLPGEVRLDFAVWSKGQLYPIFVDGQFVHKTAEQQQNDIVQDMILDDQLTGAYPAQRISGEDLQSIPAAIAKVREIFG